MPTTYTHYAYGQEVFHKLPEELQRKIEPYIEYYNIGVHGPDILFYYHSYCKNKVNQYGVKVHHEPAREFFKRAFRVFQAQENKNEAFAYLAGFMTHFILDSSCHPYVRKRIKETGISHTEIEIRKAPCATTRMGTSTTTCFPPSKNPCGVPILTRRSII